MRLQAAYDNHSARITKLQSNMGSLSQSIWATAPMAPSTRPAGAPPLPATQPRSLLLNRQNENVPPFPAPPKVKPPSVTGGEMSDNVPSIHASAPRLQAGNSDRSASPAPSNASESPATTPVRGPSLFNPEAAKALQSDPEYLQSRGSSPRTRSPNTAARSAPLLPGPRTAAVRPSTTPAATLSPSPRTSVTRPAAGTAASSARPVVGAWGQAGNLQTNARSETAPAAGQPQQAIAGAQATTGHSSGTREDSFSATATATDSTQANGTGGISMAVRKAQLKLVAEAERKGMLSSTAAPTSPAPTPSATPAPAQPPATPEIKVTKPEQETNPVGPIVAARPTPPHAKKNPTAPTENGVHVVQQPVNSQPAQGPPLTNGNTASHAPEFVPVPTPAVAPNPASNVATAGEDAEANQAWLKRLEAIVHKALTKPQEVAIEMDALQEEIKVYRALMDLYDKKISLEYEREKLLAGIEKQIRPLLEDIAVNMGKLTILKNAREEEARLSMSTQQQM